MAISTFFKMRQDRSEGLPDFYTRFKAHYELMEQMQIHIGRQLTSLADAELHIIESARAISLT